MVDLDEREDEILLDDQIVDNPERLVRICVDLAPTLKRGIVECLEKKLIFLCSLLTICHALIHV